MSTDTIDSLARALDLVDIELRTQLGFDVPPTPHSALESLFTSMETVSELLERPQRSAFDGPGTTPDLVTRSLRIQAELRKGIATWRIMRVRQLNMALARLAATDSVTALRRQACSESVRTLGYGISVFSVVQDNGWTITEWHPRPTTPQDPLFVAWSESPAEHEAYTENAVILARDEPTTAPRIRSILATSTYFVSPVATAEQRLALLHWAHPRVEILDFVEIEVLRVFATAVALVHERNDAIERNRQQRSSIKETARLLAMLADSIPCDVAEIDTRFDAEGPRTLREPDAPLTSLEALLTAREREVFRLLVAGASNSDIAEQLVISVETVKSHVKKVLRKVGAVNRSEVVSLHLRQR